MSTLTERLAVIIDANSGGAVRNIDATTSAAHRLDRGLSKVRSTLHTGFTAAKYAGIAALGATLHTGFQEVKDYQGGLSNLTAGIKSTHGVANVTARGLEDLASKIQDYSGQTDDSIVASEQLLLTFKNIRNETGKNNDIFTQATKITADMAQRLGTDAKSSAIQLGKALNDPVKGITALTRVGVSFTQQQKDQIAALVKSGDTLKAQKIILKELNDEFGGSAKLYGQTLPGEIDRTKRAWEDVSQDLVTQLTPALLDVAKFTRNDVIPALSGMAHWGKENKSWLLPVAAGLGGLVAVGKIGRGVSNVTRGLGALKGLAGGGGFAGPLGASVKRPIPVYVVNGMPGGKVPGGVVGTVEKDAERAAEVGVASRITNYIKGGLRRTPGAIGLGIAGSAAEHVIPGGAGRFTGNTLKGAGLGFQVGGPVGAATLGGLTAAGQGVVKALGAASASDQAAHERAMADVIKQLTANTKGLANLARLNQIADNQIKGSGRISTEVQEQIDLLMKALGPVANTVLKTGEAIGQDLGQGLIQGIETQIPHATVAGKILVSQTAKAMRLAADAHSPSRVTMRLGEDLAQGLIVGWTMKQQDVIRHFDKDTRTTLGRLQRDIEKARQYRSDIRGGLLGFGGLAGLGGQTDSLGSSMGQQHVVGFLKGQADSLKRFAHLLRKLEQMGLSNALLSQFAQIGPDAIPAMEELAKSEHKVHAANRQERRIQHLAAAGSRTAADARYDGQFAHLAAHLPKQIGQEVRKALRHAHFHVELDMKAHARHRGRRVRNKNG